ncbi:MAG TPA: hydantoinase/oxoprolinase family protein [Candidatus Methylomirabilis sp.]|nr:hydantoinase/oxoprolinase family protein [Candidatus Methylomirabilis sp.]
MSRYRLGVDIGGTFTDFALLDEATGQVAMLKLAATPERPAASVENGVTALLGQEGVGPEAIAAFVHGTTLAVNTVIERKGSVTGLLITRGFRDVLNIGRHRIPDVFNFFAEMPVPLVPRARVMEIPERSLADGRVALPVDEAAVAAAVDRLVAEGATAIAVSYLHSYTNAANEEATRRVIGARAPGLYVSISSEVWPQMREYERSLVAVMNAYVGRRMADYFADLERGLRARGVRTPILSTKSNGGIMSAAEAGQRPVETLLSGPAAGVIGASFVARAAGWSRVITFDMGGTSADVAVVDGEPRLSTENYVGDFPVIMPAIDVTSIGAGGGSIAWTDQDGVLKVGPHSAGARPGPACYGLGGADPTVTDAYVTLGIIEPRHFLGGSVPLDPTLAERAIGALGKRLGKGVVETAESVLRVATSQMYAALVPLMARKAINLDDFALLPFGGAGPTHGFLLAREVGIRRVIVPPSPGVLCAIGSLVADVRRDFVRTVHRPLRRADEGDLLPALRQGFAVLTRDGQRWLDAQGLDFTDVRHEWSLDGRYLGQSFELTMPVSAAVLGDGHGAALREAFHDLYRGVYGYADDAADLEILTLRTTSIGVTGKPAMPRLDAGRAPGPPAAARGERRVFLDGAFRAARVIERSELGAGDLGEGPMVIEQYDTTVLVPEGFRVRVDEFGNLIGEATDGHR